MPRLGKLRPPQANRLPTEPKPSTPAQSYYHTAIDRTGDSVVSPNRVTQAQRIIADASNASEADQNRAIEEAIQLLYPYPPRQGQRDALRQLIYKRKDLILIAKTSFHRHSPNIDHGNLVMT